MFCELLLARFGLIQQMKLKFFILFVNTFFFDFFRELDDGIAEAVTSLLWVAPRITHEVPEFKVN